MEELLSFFLLLGFLAAGFFGSSEQQHEKQQEKKLQLVLDLELSIFFAVWDRDCCCWRGLVMFGMGM